MDPNRARRGPGAGQDEWYDPRPDLDGSYRPTTARVATIAALGDTGKRAGRALENRDPGCHISRGCGRLSARQSITSPQFPSMPNDRRNTLDQAIDELLELEFVEEGVEDVTEPNPGKKKASRKTMPPPIPGESGDKSPAEDTDTSRTQAALQGAPPIDLTNDAQALVRTCQAELGQSPAPQRAARLHCELATVHEQLLGEPDKALLHFEQALTALPDHLPAIRGARRLYIVLSDYTKALPLFLAESKLCPDTDTEAMLHYERARLLEGFLGDYDAASASYEKALSLSPGNLAIIDAVKRTAVRTGDWKRVSQAFEEAANQLTGDPRLRAALIVERAKLAENKFTDIPAALALCHTALRLDPNVLGALEMLERLYHGRSEWQPLTEVLELQAQRTSDEIVRARALHKFGRLHHERLHNRNEAIRALEHANRATQKRDRLILEDLAHLYEVAQDYQSLVRIIRTLISVVETSDEQVALLHKLGDILERQMNNEEEAIGYFQTALQIEPTHLPTLQALGAVHIRRNDWRALVDMHQAEVDASNSTTHRADVHARIGEILETHLGEPQDACRHYEHALSLNPDQAAAFRAITRLYARAGRYRELTEHYERVLERAPNKSYQLTYLFKLGSLWEDALGDPSQAAYTYRRILHLDPHNLGAIHALQRATERAGQYRELVEALELEVREAKEPNVEAGLLHRAGVILDEKLGDLDGALARFNKIIQQDAGHATTLASLARIFHREGRWSHLYDVYQKQLAIAESDRAAATILNKMGALCEDKLGRQDDAVGHYKTAAKRCPDHHPSVRAWSRMVRQREDWRQLVQVLELELSTSAEAHSQTRLLFSAGYVYEDRLNRPEEAIIRYEQALAIDASYWPALVALARLRTLQSAWVPLVDDLAHQHHNTMDAKVSGAALMRQGDILRDQLQDSQRAIERFEGLVDSPSGKLPALLSLEPLYIHTQAWDALAAVYEAEADTIADAGGRVAALRNLFNVQDVHRVAALNEQSATYKQILSMAPTDVLALDGMHRIASLTNDQSTLSEVCRTLGDIAEDRSLSAYYLTSVGQALERLGTSGAGNMYRLALTKDKSSLGAIRGLARTARAVGDHQSEAHATRLEAAFLVEPRAIADLLVHSAELRLSFLDDPEGAAGDLERALEAWPDHFRAAEMIQPPLLQAGHADRLLTILSRAAGAATAPLIAARLWLAVANLHLDHLSDFGGGIAALQRGLELSPDHVSSLRRLAQVYARERRWDDSVGLYRRIVEISANRTVLCQSYLELATILDRQKDDADAALVAYEAVLDIDPYHRQALVALADFHLQRGNGDAAAQTAHRMVTSAHDTESRSWALVQLSNIEQQRGEFERAEHALIEAVALEGPSGDAAVAFRTFIEGRGSWLGYAAGLTAFVQRGSTDRALLKKAYLELAHVHGDIMGQPGQAAAKLEEGMAVVGGSQELAFELGRRMVAAGRYHEGIAQLQALLDYDVTRTEVWRTLVDTLDKFNQAQQSVLTTAPLVVLQTANSQERSKWYARTARPAEALPGTFTPELLTRLACDGALASPAAEIITILADSIGRMYRPDLEIMGISRRDRISSRSRHPIRGLADRVAALYGVEYELYLHPRTTPAASLEMTEPVSIVIAEHVADLPVAQQAFLLGMAMAPIAGRFYPVEKLAAREVRLLLAATTSLVFPEFGSDLPEDELRETAQRVKKLVPRKWRRNLELAATDYAAIPNFDVKAWKNAVHLSAMRAGLLIADDLIGVVDVIREEEDIHDARGVDLVKRSPAIADMVRFWATTEAFALRREIGAP